MFQTFKNKAPGPDQIKKIHIANFPKILFVVITQIYNYCLATGYYPPKFKIGTMIFIPKPGKDLSHAKNYRPITLLNLFGKAFGKLVNQRFVKHLTDTGKLNPLQYGFRQGRGTASSLALMYEYVAKKKGSRQFHRVSVVSRDISGAFDRVWHQKLIALFDKLDLPHLFTKLLTSFLTDRKIRIKINNFLGPEFTPEAGVPQGAPGSPDIFNISTLPLEDLVTTPHSYSPWYCDDLHQLVATPCAALSKRMHKTKVTTAIKNQNAFERSRGILTCVEKSIITPIAQLTGGNLEFKDGDETLKYPYLKRFRSTKILGLNITYSSWTNKHVEVIAAKGRQVVIGLRCMSALSGKSKLHLVKALVIPSLTYPCTPLNASSIGCFTQLQTVLNQALNFVYNNKYPNLTPSRVLHQRAKIKPINQIIFKQAKNIWNKIESGNAGDENTFRMIMREEQGPPHRWYPSSYSRAQLDKPPPIYTIADGSKPEVRRYYNS